MRLLVSYIVTNGLNEGCRSRCLLTYQDIDPMDSLVPNCYDRLWYLNDILFFLS